MTTASPARLLLRGLWATLAVALALYAAVTLGLGGPELEDVFAVWVYIGLLLVATALCVARAITVPGERLAWLALAAAPGLWAAGELVWELVLSHQEEPAYPGPADALWLGSYVAACIGIVALVRKRLRPAFRPTLLLDAALAAVALAALGAALIFGPVSAAGAGNPEWVATDLAYPLGDVLLLALVVSVLTLSGWGAGRGWWVFAVALAAQAVSDARSAYRQATGTLGDGFVLDAIWPAAALLLAWAAWRPLEAPDRRGSSSARACSSCRPRSRAWRSACWSTTTSPASTTSPRCSPRQRWRWRSSGSRSASARTCACCERPGGWR